MIYIITDDDAPGAGNLYPMDCPECQRLALERERLERAYAEAVAAIKTLETSNDTDEYRRLRAAAQEAKLDLDVASIQSLSIRTATRP